MTTPAFTAACYIGLLDRSTDHRQLEPSMADRQSKGHVASARPEGAPPYRRVRMAMGMQASRRVFSRRLDWDLSPADVLRMVRADAHPVALLGAWAGGADIVASNPVRVCQQLRSEDCDEVDGDAAGASFGGGWIGYLGFDAAGYMMPAPPSPGGPPQLPASWFGYYDHVLRRDRASGRWSFEALVTPERAASLECRLGELSRRSQLPRPKPRAYSCSAFRLTSTPEEHKAAVRQTVDSIRRG